MRIEDYQNYDATGLAELIASGQVTAQELNQTAMAVMEQLNPKINAVVYTMFDESKAAADSEALAGPFKGVPFLLKDLGVAVAGHPSSYSSHFSQDYTPDYDSIITERFKKAGLNILGKTNAPEFGILGVTESRLRGVCRNPWNLNLTSGGSSGGAAAAVAARIVPVAHADDGGGSIRIPASACGLVGLKPTRGRVPLGPGKTESWLGLVSSFVVTRSVRDAAAVLDAVAGPEVGAPYFAPPTETPYAEEIKKPRQNIKIAYSTDSILGRETDPECKRAVETTAQLCQELGHEVVPAAPQLDVESLRWAYFVIVASSVATDIERLASLLNKKVERKHFEDTTWFLYLLGHQCSAVELQQAIQIARECGESLARFFQKHDLWLTPTLAHPPSPVGLMELGFLDRLGIRLLDRVPLKPIMMQALKMMAKDGLEKTPNTQIFNLSGTPAISLPVYETKEHLPIGVQFAGAMGREDLLLNLAQQLEKVSHWLERKPQLLDQFKGH